MSNSSNQSIWEPYKKLVGIEKIDQLFHHAHSLKGAKIVHVNSTKEGGGVAEILNKMVPLMIGLGLDVRWEVLEGNPDFFQCTKTFHNLFQGSGQNLPPESLLRNYEEVNTQNSKRLAPVLEDADFVFIHDPQPLPLILHFPQRKGKWVWRCHIETSSASQGIWRYLRQFIDRYDARIFSLDNFNQPLPLPIYIIPPSIDPFSEKNIELTSDEIGKVFHQFALDTKRPILLQVSRFDQFKDPQGVIIAYQLVKHSHPDLQLILAGGSAIDDPEGAAVLKEIQASASKDIDIHVLDLPSNSYRIINALQRGADIILQKSTKEGFGLTVTEALWKSKPVIGGNTGGIRIQVLDQQTGLLVDTPEGAAKAIEYLLKNQESAKKMGMAGKQLVKEKFLISRHIRDYLNVMTSLSQGHLENVS